MGDTSQYFTLFDCQVISDRLRPLSFQEASANYKQQELLCWQKPLYNVREDVQTVGLIRSSVLLKIYIWLLQLVF